MSFAESHGIHYRPRESEFRRKLISLGAFPLITIAAYFLFLRAILCLLCLDDLIEMASLNAAIYQIEKIVFLSLFVFVDICLGISATDDLSIIVYSSLISSVSFAAVHTWLDIKRVNLSFEKRRRLAGATFDSVKGITDDSNGIFSGRFNKQDFYARQEDRGLVIGPPRTGKTTFLLNQILRLSKNKQSFVAVDIKPELSQILRDDLEKSGYKVIVLDPIFASGLSYNPLADITNEQAINELVLSLIPTPLTDPIWKKAEQRYFRLALLYLFHSKKKVCSLPAAYQLIAHFDTAEAFLKYVGQSTNDKTKQSAKKLLGELANSKPAQSGFSAVFDSLDWLSYSEVQAALGENEFSLAGLGQKEAPIALFLQFEESYLETMSGLLSALCGHILRYLIVNYKKREAVALFFDEIGNLPPISGLLQKLNTIASRNIPLWMYWQSTAQMSVYGINAREVFFGCADVQLFFRSNDLNTQQTVAQLSGTVYRPKMSQASNGDQDSKSVSAEKDTRIQAGDVGELGFGEVIAFYRGKKLRGCATPHYETFPKYRR
ncbi:MAG: type IV secretory system conjugative DNA transfer family protein [Hahellaceae bacterium]|nr:type IV secretory system conjugative DNA transfer family protein [Hahellaceae bacterium]MCP5212226.1 type IV secretory system conjugative DNA transfer family protein [Hahellaceae bacterium]